MNKLIQKKNFVKREFRITDSKLFYSISKLGNSTEVAISYESIDGDKVTHNSSKNIILFVAAVLYLIAISIQVSNFRDGLADPLVALIWAGIATVVLIIYWFTRENYWKIKLSGNSYIYVHKHIPTESETDRFLADLMNSRNAYLKENYAKIDENLGYENQLNNLKWLKSISAISTEEFNSKCMELKRVAKPDKPIIGFGKEKS